jgi:hypothetical protein
MLVAACEKEDLMRRLLWVGVLTFAVALLVGFGPAETWAGGCEKVTGKEFDSGFVPHFYLEGNSIPTQKRNAAMLKCMGGKRLVFGLLDTTGYSADIQKKYHGMAILEQKVTFGTAELGVGAYGFGLEKAGEAKAEKAKDLGQPVPLQVVTAAGKAPALCLGLHCVEIK